MADIESERMFVATRLLRVCKCRNNNIITATTTAITTTINTRRFVDAFIERGTAKLCDVLQLCSLLRDDLRMRHLIAQFPGTFTFIEVFVLHVFLFFVCIPCQN